MIVGFMLGVLTRNSAAAIVAYFTYWFVVPTLSMVLAANQAWFEKAQPWVDFNFNQGRHVRRWLHRAGLGPARRSPAPSGWCCRWPSASGA